jgi:WD40 repeat protein
METKTRPTTISPRDPRRSFVLSHRHAALGVGLLALVAGCGRDYLIGIDLDGTGGKYSSGSGGQYGGTGGQYIGTGGQYGGTGGQYIGTGGQYIGTGGQYIGTGGQYIGSGGSGGQIIGGSGGQNVGGIGGHSPCPLDTTPGEFNDCGPTRSVALSPDGSRLVTITPTGGPVLSMWALPTGDVLGTLEDDSVGPKDALSVAYSPDGTLIASAGYATNETNAIQLWDPTTRKLVRSLPTHCGSYSGPVSFSGDGTRLAAGGDCPFVEVWNVKDGTEVSLLSTGPGTNLRFSPDGSRVITFTESAANFLSVTTGAVVAQTPAAAGVIIDAAYSPDGQRLLTVNRAGQVNVLSLPALAIVATMDLRPTGPGDFYTTRAIWAGNDAIVGYNLDGVVKEWKAGQSGTFQLAQTWSVANPYDITASADGKTVLIGTGQGMIFLAP